MNPYTSSKFRTLQIVSHVQSSIVPLLQIQSLDITSILSNCNLVRLILVLYYTFPPFTLFGEIFERVCFRKRGSLIARPVLKAENRLPGIGDVILQSERLRIKYFQVNNNGAPMRSQTGVKIQNQIFSLVFVIARTVCW